MKPVLHHHWQSFNQERNQRKSQPLQVPLKFQLPTLTLQMPCEETFYGQMRQRWENTVLTVKHGGGVMLWHGFAARWATKGHVTWTPYFSIYSLVNSYRTRKNNLKTAHVNWSQPKNIYNKNYYVAYFKLIHLLPLPHYTGV